MHDARALTARGPEPGRIFAVSQHENIHRKTPTYLQPTLGRDNDPRGEHSATVNALQNQPVNLTPRRSDAGARFPCGGQESWSWTLVAYRAKNDRRADLVWQHAYNRYQLQPARDS
jgi:hypothetical protein